MPEEAGALRDIPVTAVTLLDRPQTLQVVALEVAVVVVLAVQVFLVAVAG
jgi:hypothetical protein